MKVMMVTNYPPLQLQKTMFVNEGWVSGLQDLLKKVVQLYIIFYAKDDSQEYQIDENCRAYSYNNVDQVKSFVLNNDIDVIHIMGTEFKWSYQIFDKMRNAGYAERTVVSVQGLVSFCAMKYSFGVPQKYCYGFSLMEIYGHFKSLRKDAKDYLIRGRMERQLIKESVHVIGRTNWDRRCVTSINRNVIYHYNGENLRNEFYENGSWNINVCEKYSIFVSQATYCLKGFHHLLEVLPIIVAAFPDTKVYVGGNSPIAKQKWKRNSYGNYLVRLMKEGKTASNVVFCGAMSAEQMRKRYLQSHVFLSPSNIENSSNSIGEAMILGVPTVASNVGGTDCLIDNGVNGLLYPLTEPYIMAEEIIEIFRNDDLAQELSIEAQKKALSLHDREQNVKELLKIYRELCE